MTPPTLVMSPSSRQTRIVIEASINGTPAWYISLFKAFFCCFFLHAAKRIQDLFWINISWSLQRRDVCNSASGAAQLSSSSLHLFSSLLCPPPLMLAASGGSPRRWPLASVSNDLIFPSCLPPCHLSLFPRGWRDGGLGEGTDGVCFFWKLCIFSPQQLSAPFNQSSCPSVLSVSWISLFLLPLSLI